MEHEDSVKGAVFSKNDSTILTWSQDGTARLWDSKTGKPFTSSMEHKGKVKGAVFSKDESRILTWSQDGTARIWDSKMGKLLNTMEHKGRVNSPVFSKDESRILTWSGNTARVWNFQFDYDFPRDKLVLKLEVLTGTTMNDVGDFEALTLKEWRKKKHEYEKIAREHAKVCKYPHANEFLNRQ